MCRCMVAWLSDCSSVAVSQSGLGQLTGARCAVWVSVSLDGPRMRGCVGHTWVRGVRACVFMIHTSAVTLQ